ncbi:MAG TPA: ATP-binding cassette domain-containing protein [Desulfitobacteriaceae bacterium]|nr:ATP-binding cassette domain-containing protein [Desulfitobacteriaceae bacterium]
MKHLTFGFVPEKQILRDLSLSLEKEKIYALMGGNGAGKTTLFNLITGFIKPQNGQILFSGKNLVHQPPFTINRQGIGRTFQDLRLITKLTVKENVILAMQHNPTDNWLHAMLPEQFYRSINKLLAQRADEIVEEYHLCDVKSSLASDVSYGQQKLLTLACCVANGAKLLLLDEAVAGIQPEFRIKIAKHIRTLREQGKTILLIEHNTDFIADVADTIFFLNEGVFSSFETMDKLRKNKQIMSAYI